MRLMLIFLSACSGSVVLDGGIDAATDVSMVDVSMMDTAMADSPDVAMPLMCPMAGSTCTTNDAPLIRCTDATHFIACDGSKWFAGECPKDAIPGSCAGLMCNAAKCQ